MTVLDREFRQSLPLEEGASEPLAGGLMQGYQCGMLWGSSLAAGARAYNLWGPGADAERAAVHAAHGLVEAFRAENQHVNCLEITETDPKDKWQTFVHFLVKGGVFRCFGRAASYAPMAYRAITAAFSQRRPGVGCDAASCASVVARKLGASDLHATMAAGLAGGIGLSGGACGALGAAIWLTSMNGREQGVGGTVINSRIDAVTETFQKVSDFRFECSEIVGRRFEDTEDHGRHLREGGCKAIIEALAQPAAM
jgi:hypothetical protein